MRTNKIKIILYLCVASVYCLNQVAYAQLIDTKLNSDFRIDRKPASSVSKWTGLFGEYQLGNDTLLIREKLGNLQVIFNPDTSLDEYNLVEISKDAFKLEAHDSYSNITFKRDEKLQGLEIHLDNKIYPRNHIEPQNGETYKVELDKPIEDYVKEALLAEVPVEDGEFLPSDLVDVTKYIDHVKLDVRYATTNNFLGVATYSQAKTFLQRPAVMAIANANKKLNELGYGLLMHDGYRPWYVTKIFWEATDGFERDFVANPASGSRHNRGCAIDLTLYELSTGKVIKMVGTYDEMSQRSYPDYKGGSSLERWHRDLLRSVMEENGFRVNSLEWWHFDFKGWEKYLLLNQKFEELSLKE